MHEPRECQFGIVGPLFDAKIEATKAEAIRAAQHWEAGLTFAFIPKGTGVLLVPVPKRDALRGLAKGANAEGYRDRKDRH